MAYLTRARMEHAAHLLQNGAQTLDEIALAAGYASPAAFSVAFKRWSGRTPRGKAR
jgi:AraC-like DNA-binding protein